MATVKKESPRSVVQAAISRIEGDNAYTDIVLSHLLTRHSLAERERAFVTQVVRGAIRWKKRFDWIIDHLFLGQRDQLPRPVRWLLWGALYQLEFMKVPSYAAVNEAVHLARMLKLHRWAGLVNGILRAYVRKPEAIVFPDAKTSPVEHLAFSESHPEWLVDQLLSQFGFEETHAICRANNHPPDLILRVNRRKISADDFAEWLKQNGVEFQLSPVAGFYRIRSIDYAFRSRLLAEGMATVQDDSAGLIGLLADPQRDQIFADLCAAPGGKSTHVAELMDDRGFIVSGDLNQSRAASIDRAARRLGLSSVHPVVADARQFPLRQADIVLLDAPCSGLGVLRKKPDLRWRKNASDLSLLAVLQRQLIHRAGELVKAGGSLIYSTCTIPPAENEMIVDEFLGKNPQFEIVHAKTSTIADEFITERGFIRTWTHKHDMDGSFAAKMIKRNF
ncbi:16S rRNA (cytosine(967)-C(5))-methyltransferase RsmB [candidate division KSB1 bacterium]|nr:16S rRNA (cytosine(967)-C(5))-methyltransferase RsmB [candidate division KSB1 bacterium]